MSPSHDAAANSSPAKLHLALLCNEYPPLPHGGIGSFCQDLAEAMVDHGQTVTVLGLSRHTAQQPTSSRPGLEFRYLSPTKFRLPWAFAARWERLRLRRLLQNEHARNPFHLVEFMDYEGWLPYGGLKGIPTIARLQGSNLLFDHELKRYSHPLIHQFETRALIRSDYWIGVSDYAFRSTLQLVGRSEKRGEIIYNPVDTELFCPPPDIHAEPGLIVFVNSIGQRKGVDTLLLAAKEVFPDQPTARLVLIGGEPKCPDFLRPIWDSLAAETRSRIQFLGRLDRRTGVLNWIRRASVCCYPSRVETFGIAPVEAMAAGKATIYTQRGPGPEVIEDGVSGLLCDPDNPAQLASQITRLLNDPAFALQLGANGRRRAVEKFSRAALLPQNLACYRSLASRSLPL